MPLTPTPQRRWKPPGAAAVLAAIWVITFRLLAVAAPLPTAGRLAAPPPPANPASEAADASARKIAETFLAALSKKDAVAMAAVCDVPFLGGGVGRPQVLPDIPARDKSLHDDLATGPYTDSMFQPLWDITRVLSPSEFNETYGEHVADMGPLASALAAMKLTDADRLVIESHRGMLLIVRGGTPPRVAGVVPLGFHDRQFDLTRDVIYGRKYGAALTLDVLRPQKNSNRAAVLEIISDTFVSHPPRIGFALTVREQGLLDAGFTVIYVTHSGSPKNTIPETVADLHRAVRFVRFNATKLGIDPDRIAVMGGSSGGYLALMLGVADGHGPPFPPPADPTSAFQRGDPVEAVSSRVQAVVAYYGPTDWLNYGAEGKPVSDHPLFRLYRGVLELYDFDAAHVSFEKITDHDRIARELTDLSPVNRITSHAAPTLLFHGGKDTNVPLQQSQKMADALKAANVPLDLVIKPEEGHGWADNPEDTARIVGWLNRYLLPAP